MERIQNSNVEAYKIFMKIIKEKIEQHIVENDVRREEQAGLTRGGEILDNLVVLRGMVRQVYRRKEELGSYNCSGF